jgi:catechol 2,3-dioxygenase-like lactoylglutathione lyase family enzyme
MALLRKLDNHMLRVDDLDAAIAFYCDGLKQPLLWRDERSAAFALPETDAELVVHLDIGPETDVLVDDVEEAVAAFVKAGGEIARAPFGIPIGKCAVVKDPFGNELVLLDQSKGMLKTDQTGKVVGVEPRPPTARSDRRAAARNR